MELGYAPNTPSRAAVGTGTSGATRGFAWQVQLSLLDIFPGHSFALQHGRADAGWLISPDFRNNEVLSELRYEWQIDECQAFTVRFRHRDEKDTLAGAARKQRDDDFSCDIRSNSDGRVRQYKHGSVAITKARHSEAPRWLWIRRPSGRTARQRTAFGPAGSASARCESDAWGSVAKLGFSSKIEKLGP